MRFADLVLANGIARRWLFSSSSWEGDDNEGTFLSSSAVVVSGAFVAIIFLTSSLAQLICEV